MRTKVEKRRVRQDPALVTSPAASQPAPLSSQGDGGVAASVLASAVLPGTARDLRSDADHRPVSITEAQRRAAANHVVVALGPPVIMGHTRLMFDGKSSGGGSVAGDDGGGGGDGIAPALTDGVSKVYDKLSSPQPVNAVVTPEEKAIKKPPKKRRNNEKKVEVALDLSTTSVVHGAAGKELHPAVAEPMLIAAPLPVQLQHPPITPPTPSPQHPLTCSPQHGSLHGSLLCRSPPNPTHLLQQTPPSSSEPVLMDTMADSVDMVSSTDGVSDLHPAAGEGGSVTQFLRSGSEMLPLPESDLVLPLSHTHQADMQPLVRQPEAIQTLDAEEGELSSATSTSLLQPPTWLLTPQENPPGREGSELEPLAASNPRTAQAVPEASSEPVLSSPTKTNKKAGKKTASKSKSAKGRKTAEEEMKNSSEKSTGDCAVVSQSKDSSTVTASVSSSAGNASITPTKESSSGSSGSTKSTPKSEKPQKKKPTAGDENSALRLRQIEETINCVIARYVYNSDNVEEFDKIRQAAREADAKAESAENKFTANSSVAVETEAAAVAHSVGATPVSSEAAAESQQSTNPGSDVSVTPVTPKPKRKPAARKKQSEPKAASSSQGEEKPTAGTEETVDVQTTSPKKKSKKSKKKDANQVTEDSQNENGSVSSGKKGTKAKSAKVAEAPSKESEGAADASTGEQVKPPPAKKRRTSKKKDSQTTAPMEVQPSSDVIPNGHLETEPLAETPKPVKKTKSKPRAKKQNQVNDKTPDKQLENQVNDKTAGNQLENQANNKTPDNQLASNGTEASQTTDPVNSGTVAPEAENKKAEKTPAKPKPKKARKRKSDNPEDAQSSEKKDAGESEATGGASKDAANSECVNEENTEANSESVKPPPKKKKKKEPKEGEKAEPKKKKSPSKSKKAKASATQQTQTTDTGEAAPVENGLPDPQNGDNSDAKSPEDGEPKSTEEASTSTEEGKEAKSTTTVEKKVKKTLDEVICPDCGHKTRGQAALSRHMKKLHEKSVVLPYPCPKQPNCDYSASKVSLLARHMMTHGLYMCSRCQFTVDTKDKYEEHLQSAHNVKLDCKLCKKCCRYVKCDTMPMEQHLEVCQGPVPFTCDVCGKQFKYESSLKVHHHTHFPDQPKLYHCSQCEYASNYRANLHKHVQNMHMQRPRDIKCHLCDKMFSTEDNMRRHMKIHTQVRPYKCHKCEKAFKSQCALRGHLVSHEVARPYKCNIDNCQREFRTPKFLKSHQEEFHRLIPKKYHCNVEGCNYSFFKLSHLKRHEISHTGARNFHCNHPGCGKSFRHADNLKVHLRQHTNERPISCPHCKFTCRQKSSLQWHVKKEHNQTLPADAADNGVGKEVVIPLDGKPLEGFTLPKGMTFPEGFKLPESLTLPEGVKLPEGVDLTEGVEVVELEKINVIIPAGEGEELPVTITELRPMDLYDFHSDNDSSDEATPGVFKRDKTKMASAAPLPPAPKELLMKNAVFDVLSDEAFKPAAEGGASKSKKKKSSGKKSAKSKETTPKEGEDESKKSDKDSTPETGADEGKKKKKKASPKKTPTASPTKKTSPESKKKATTPKSKKKAAKPDGTEEKENKKKKPKKKSEKPTEETGEKADPQNNNDPVDPANEKTDHQNEEKPDNDVCEKKQDDDSQKTDSQSEEIQDDGSGKQDGQAEETPADESETPTQNNNDHSKDETKADETALESKAQSKSPSRAKKAAPKKKAPAKAAPKDEETPGGEKEKPAKTKAPAKGKKSPKTRASPKKPTSPKGKPAKAATRKTPPRKAATAKKGGQTGGKKTPAKKGAAKKKTTTKKKAAPKKKTTKKTNKDKEEKSVEVEAKAEEEQKEEQAPVVEPKPKEPGRIPRRMLTVFRPRETRNSLAAAEEASSPIRPSSPIDSEEENMPQGAGSPYREFDSQDMDDSSPEPRKSPSPPPSPPRVEEQPVSSPVPELESSPKGEEDNPEMAETREEAEEGSDVEDIMNDIPLTPPRAPAPPPQESSDEEEMIPSPPAQMPLSADTSDTAAPSSVMTDQPGSQAPDFQQPHSREEFQQPHSHQDFQQPHSREEFPQPLSQQPQSVEYPQHHSREEIAQPHSREDYPQHHSREEYSQPHSREDYSQPLSREDYSQPLSREEYPQPLSREEYSQPHSREEYSQPHSREEYPPQHSREEYSQPLSREEYSQQHSREDLQPQGSVPEPMSESAQSVRSEGLPEDVPMPHSVTPYDAVAAQSIPTSEAESAYQYLQGLAQAAEPLSEPLAGEPSRLQQLEALAEKPHEDSRGVTDIVKSPVGAAPTSVITSLSPSATSLPISTPETSSRRMEILSTDRQVEQALIRDSPVLPRLGEGAYDAFSALNPLAASAARDNGNLFPAPPGTPSFMRLTESEAMLQRQRMATPFLPTAQPERSLSRLPESSLQPPNPSALLRRPPTMAEGMFSGTAGMPQTMPRNPFTNTWAGQDVRPSHWGQAPTYLQRPTNAPTTPFPFPTKDNYQFMFDPTGRPAMTDRNMFASLSGSQSQRDLASEPTPFQLDRFDLSTYFGSHPYSGAAGLDYSRSAVSAAASKTFDERYRQTAVSMSEFRPLPPTTSTDMFSGIGVGVNSLNSASFNLDKYAMYGRDPMYHAAAQQLSDNTNSAFLTHATPTQHSMFDRDYPHRSLYPQNPAYPLFNERQYPSAAKLTGHPTPAAMSHERDFMTRPSANENQMQDPYRCGVLYNVVNRYSFE